MAISDAALLAGTSAALLAGISAAFIVLKNARKNAKNTGDRYGLKIILKVEIPE
jgi:hypothetical protein